MTELTTETNTIGTALTTTDADGSQKNANEETKDSADAQTNVNVALTKDEQQHDDGDDDDEDDGDYVPDAEGKDDDDDGNNAMDIDGAGNDGTVLPTCTLSVVKRKAVDDAFQELFGYAFGTTFQPKRRRYGHDTDDATDGPSDGRDGQQFRLLERVFGTTVANKLMMTSHSVKDINVVRAPRPDLSAPTIVTETRIFAGKKIEVQRKVVPSATATTAAASNLARTPVSSSTLGQGSKGAPITTIPVTTSTGNPSQGGTPTPSQSQQLPTSKPKGIDSLLKEIAGPSQLSTVAKTSSDWDAFKTDTGMEEQLEQQAQSKTAFLVKKDFLNRVDARRFEHEKEKRDQERTKRGK